MEDYTTEMFRNKRRMQDMKWKRQKEEDDLLGQHPPIFLKIYEELKKINANLKSIKKKSNPIMGCTQSPQLH